jgi:hypothetical protein
MDLHGEYNGVQYNNTIDTIMVNESLQALYPLLIICIFFFELF